MTNNQRISTYNKGFNILSCISAVKVKPLGAALSITGIPLGMYLDFLLKGFTHWTTLFMVLSVILLVNWKNLLRLRFPSYSPGFGWIILFQFVMLGYAASRIMNFTSMRELLDPHYLTFHFYIIALCFAYSTINDCSDFDQFVESVFWTSIPSVLLGAIFCYLGLVIGDAAYLLKSEDRDSFNIDPLTVSLGALYSFYSVLLITKKSIKGLILKYLIAVLSLYVLLDCGKRTPMIILLISIIIFCYVRRKFSLRLSDLRIIVAFIILSIGAYFSIDYVQERINLFFESFYNGMLGIMGDDTADYNKSIAERLYRRKWAEECIDDFSIINYIFGRGYLFSWLDFPVLSAFIDMGLIGATFYFFLIVLFPVHVILRRINNDNLIIAILFSLYPLFTIASSGIIYSPSNYVTICILTFFLVNISKERKVQKHMLNNDIGFVSAKQI